MLQFIKTMLREYFQNGVLFTYPTMQMMHTYSCREGDIASKIVLVFLATNVVVDRPYIIMGTV